MPEAHEFGNEPVGIFGGIWAQEFAVERDSQAACERNGVPVQELGERLAAFVRYAADQPCSRRAANASRNAGSF